MKIYKTILIYLAVVVGAAATLSTVSCSSTKSGPQTEKPDSGKT